MKLYYAKALLLLTSIFAQGIRGIKLSEVPGLVGDKLFGSTIDNPTPFLLLNMFGQKPSIIKLLEKNEKTEEEKIEDTCLEMLLEMFSPEKWYNLTSYTFEYHEASKDIVGNLGIKAIDIRNLLHLRIEKVIAKTNTKAETITDEAAKDAKTLQNATLKLFLQYLKTASLAGLYINDRYSAYVQALLDGEIHYLFEYTYYDDERDKKSNALIPKKGYMIINENADKFEFVDMQKSKATVDNKNKTLDAIYNYR